MKNKWLTLSLIGVLGVLIIALLIATSSVLLFLSDSYFIIGILLLILGLLGLVLKQGTFDFFHYSLNRAKDKLFKVQEQKDSDNKQLHRLSRSVPSSYLSFIKAGSVFLLCSILCILIYYLLNT